MDTRTSPPQRLIDARRTAEKLGCSWRTVLRLADAGKIPFGVKLGSLRRWNEADLDTFIANGCKPLKTKGGR